MLLALSLAHTGPWGRWSARAPGATGPCPGATGARLSSELQTREEEGRCSGPTWSPSGLGGTAPSSHHGFMEGVGGCVLAGQPTSSDPGPGRGGQWALETKGVGPEAGVTSRPSFPARPRGRARGAATAAADLASASGGSLPGGSCSVGPWRGLSCGVPSRSVGCSRKAEAAALCTGGRRRTSDLHTSALSPGLYKQAVNQVTHGRARAPQGGGQHRGPRSGLSQAGGQGRSGRAPTGSPASQPESLPALPGRAEGLE